MIKDKENSYKYIMLLVFQYLGIKETFLYLK